MIRIWNKNEVLGKMNQRIVIQSVTETRSASGAVTETWATFATVWAGVEMVDSTSETTEKQMIDRQTVKNTTRFTVRHRTDINEKMRISFESAMVSVCSVDSDAFCIPDSPFVSVSCFCFAAITSSVIIFNNAFSSDFFIVICV